MIHFEAQPNRHRFGILKLSFLHKLAKFGCKVQTGQGTLWTISLGTWTITLKWLFGADELRSSCHAHHARYNGRISITLLQISLSNSELFLLKYTENTPQKITTIKTLKCETSLSTTTPFPSGGPCWRWWSDALVYSHR